MLKYIFIMEIAKTYLNDFGIDLNLEELTDIELSKIPYIFKEIYYFKKAKIFDTIFLIAKQKNKTKYTANNYKKHSELLFKNLGYKVIFQLNNMLAYNRNRLKENRINFILANKQIYLPDLLINFTNFGFTEKKVTTQLSPISQFLILYHLLKTSIEYKSIEEIARDTNYSKMSISRAIKELTETGLCSEKRNKEVEIYFNKTNREIWNDALPFMSSPVIKNFYTTEKLANNLFLSTNLSALSYYTDIADDGQKRFAIYKKDFYSMINQKKMQLNEIEGEEYIEVWKYQPKKLSDSKFVDPLSLYLIFRDTEDERIEFALKNLISNLW